MECEMCGREVSRTIKVRIEGAVLNVCRNCSRLGVPLSRKRKVLKRERKREEIPETRLDPDFASKIRKAREMLKMAPEDVARKARMSPSYFEKLESGKLKPTMDDAKRLEKVLGVSVIIEVKREEKKKDKPAEKKKEPRTRKQPDGTVSLGDVVQIKVKKSSE